MFEGQASDEVKEEVDSDEGLGRVKYAYLKYSVICLLSDTLMLQGLVALAGSHQRLMGSPIRSR